MGVQSQVEKHKFTPFERKPKTDIGEKNDYIREGKDGMIQEELKGRVEDIPSRK